MYLLICTLVWMFVGFFTAWIAQHLESRDAPAGIGNMSLAVLGALIGGFCAHAAYPGHNGYDAMLVSSLAALLVAAGLLALADVGEHRGHARRHLH